jgi:hypothetical protein
MFLAFVVLAMAVVFLVSALAFVIQVGRGE